MVELKELEDSGIFYLDEEENEDGSSKRNYFLNKKYNKENGKLKELKEDILQIFEELNFYKFNQNVKEIFL